MLPGSQNFLLVMQTLILLFSRLSCFKINTYLISRRIFAVPDLLKWRDKFVIYGQTSHESNEAIWY